MKQVNKKAPDKRETIFETEHRLSIEARKLSEECKDMPHVKKVKFMLK